MGTIVLHNSFDSIPFIDDDNAYSPQGLVEWEDFVCGFWGVSCRHQNVSLFTMCWPASNVQSYWVADYLCSPVVPQTVPMHSGVKGV